MTTLAAATAAGLSRDALRRDVDAQRLDRPYRGVYGPHGPLDDIARLRAALLHLGPESVAVLGSAALVHGLQGVPRGWTPQAALPPGLERRQRSGLDLHFWDLAADEVTEVDGVAVTSLRRTLADVCRLLPRFTAVACVDSALDSGAIAPANLDSIRHLMERRRNAVAGRRHLLQARPGAQSPLETRVRLRAGDAGLAPDRLQVPVHSPAGVLLGYGDLGYRLPGDGWLIVEADGRNVHELPQAVLHDRRRQNSFVSVPGISVLRFTWADTLAPAYIPGVLRPMLARAGWTPRPARS